jgi:hypothetical protein
MGTGYHTSEQHCMERESRRSASSRGGGDGDYRTDLTDGGGGEDGWFEAEQPEGNYVKGRQSGEVISLLRTKGKGEREAHDPAVSPGSALSHPRSA